MSVGAVVRPMYPKDPTIPNAELTSSSGNSSTTITYMLIDNIAVATHCNNLATKMASTLLVKVRIKSDIMEITIPIFVHHTVR